MSDYTSPPPATEDDKRLIKEVSAELRNVLLQYPSMRNDHMVIACVEALARVAAATATERGWPYDAAVFFCARALGTHPASNRTGTRAELLA